MHEESKLKEAGYFLMQMIANEDDLDAFAHNLSAFLSAARSVVQYAMEEAEQKTGGMEWYTGQVARSNRPVVGFFKDLRDVNIHAKPVGPKRIIHVEAVTTLHITGSLDVSVKYFDKEGNPVETHTPPAPPEPSPAPYQAKPPSVQYVFENWAGTEDIPTLCNEYLKQLREIVEDGRDRSFLTS